MQDSRLLAGTQQGSGAVRQLECKSEQHLDRPKMERLLGREPYVARCSRLKTAFLCGGALNRLRPNNRAETAGLGAYVEEVLALEGEGVEGRKRAHDLLDQHISAPGQLIKRLGGVSVTCTVKCRPSGRSPSGDKENTAAFYASKHLNVSNELVLR